MPYDQDKVDEATLALLFLGLTRSPDGTGRAWKAFDLQTLARLHQKGWIAAPKIKDITVMVTPEGVKQAEALFKRYFQNAAPPNP
jgi:hypothetical protein